MKKKGDKIFLIKDKYCKREWTKITAVFLTSAYIYLKHQIALDDQMCPISFTDENTVVPMHLVSHNNLKTLFLKYVYR